MAELTDEEYEAANERGKLQFVSQPHAATAYYDRATGLMTLTLFNGCTFSFPPRQLQGLQQATDEQIEAYELGAVGYGLHWEELDADFTVPGLLAGRFGTNRFMKAHEARLGAIYDQLLSDRSSDGWDAQAAE
ncbi:DUF2442 domain-containing protein [Sphingomonas sp.]|jgi:hypothetical protein|uniref:DUF2442 domain-containing protein n=1 Tax=Sphingomonas sp. TaxID=28214 RepID=UPI002D8003B8|nr:DUF2442 domain-containing protein [Sphingomonas sp.]